MSHALHGQPLLTTLKRFDWSTEKLNLKILRQVSGIKFLPSLGRPSFSRRSFSFEICCLIVVFETLGLVGFWFWGWFNDQGISLAISASTWSIRNIISWIIFTDSSNTAQNSNWKSRTYIIFCEGILAHQLHMLDNCEKVWTSKNNIRIIFMFFKIFKSYH